MYSKSWNHDFHVSLSTLSFFFKIVWAFPVPLSFHINFIISLSIAHKKHLGIWYGLVSIYRSIWGELSTALALHIHEYGIFLYLFRSLKICLCDVCWFSEADIAHTLLYLSLKMSCVDTIVIGMFYNIFQLFVANI